jgi:hypothetical protein
MTPEAQQLIRFYKTLERAQWTDSNHVYGSFSVNEETKRFVAQYGDALNIDLENHEGILIDQDNIEQYQNLQIRFLPLRNESLFFAKDLEDYLRNFNFLYMPPKEFYIADIDAECEDNQTTNEKIKSYLSVIQLFNFLNGLADHVEKNQNGTSLIFISSTSKEELPIKYTHTIFEKKAPIYDIIKLKEEILSPPHTKTKISLFKKAITSHTQGLNEENKLASLFSNLKEIEKKFSNNYDLFLNEFSFENEKEKLEEKKQSYLLKINEIISGIHGKLFAVPASVIIVAGQMKTPADAGYQLVNSIILIGAFVFALFMWMLTANQLHSLNALKTDFKAKKDRLKSELRESLFSDLNHAFTQLDVRFSYQRRMILLIDILVLMGLLFSFIVFEYQTQLIADWIT